VPTHATSKAAIPFRVARQVVLDHSELNRAGIRLETTRSTEVIASTYKDAGRVSIGQSCAAGCG